MTEQINDQISAFIDDELPEEESAFLLRRMERDPDARGQALRYTMIGSALRNELIGPDPAILRRRLAVALTGAPLPAARPAARQPSPYARPLLGFGIAASVAVAAIFGLRAMNDARVAPAVPAAGSLAASAPRPESRLLPPTPASDVVPQDVSTAPVLAPQIRLTNYLMHHGEYASRLSRTSVHSNVVGTTERLPEAVVQPASTRPGLPQAAIQPASTRTEAR
jgi:sigma-E factor negative regulatory protein RseA